MKDLDIKSLIKKYPLETRALLVHQEENKNATVEIINKVNSELSTKNTKRFCNFINMNMLIE